MAICSSQKRVREGSQVQRQTRQRGRNGGVEGAQECILKKNNLWLDGTIITAALRQE